MAGVSSICSALPSMNSSSVDPDDSTSSLLPLSLFHPMSVSYPSSQLQSLYLHHNTFICIIWDEVFLVEILSDFRELSFCLCIFYMCVCLHVQSCLTLCDPMDCSLPGSSVHGTLQARKLEQFAISSFGDLTTWGLNLHLLHWQANSSPLHHHRVQRFMGSQRVGHD